MQPKHILLTYLIGILASILFLWPVAFVALFFFAHANGDLSSER
jgi:hypothetical protein